MDTFVPQKLFSPGGLFFTFIAAVLIKKLFFPPKKNTVSPNGIKFDSQSVEEKNAKKIEGHGIPRHSVLAPDHFITHLEEGKSKERRMRVTRNGASEQANNKIKTNKKKKKKRYQLPL